MDTTSLIPRRGNSCVAAKEEEEMQKYRISSAKENKSIYRIYSNIGPVLYLTPVHRGPGLYCKEANIRDRPLFPFEEN